MHRDKRIAIILSDTLRRVGLRSLLADYFAPIEICHFPAFEPFAATGGDAYDYYFTDPETFVLNPDFFLPRRHKTALLIDKDEESRDSTTTGHNLMAYAPPETILEQIRRLFANGGAPNPLNAGADTGKELSSRETDVLQLIVRGGTNKEIADRLNISLNTVLTHRKNITAKLGIKTVSGLTFYAIMNGIISGDDIGTKNHHI